MVVGPAGRQRITALMVRETLPRQSTQPRPEDLQTGKADSMVALRVSLDRTPPEMVGRSASTRRQRNAEE